MKSSKDILRESTEHAEDIIAKRYVPFWLFRMFRAQKKAVLWCGSMAKYISGCLFLTLAFAVTVVGLIVLLPSRHARIKFCNHFGTVFGSFNVWLSGSSLTCSGTEHLDRNKPAVYIVNHASVMDLFITMWKTPTGTCSVGKKQVIYYPLFGILYLLSGHLIIDRGNNKKAVASMKKMSFLVKKYGLSAIIFAEGTRSKNGRLGKFKKGFVHMAIQTGLPVVPIILTGTHRAWQARSTTIGKTDMGMHVLPPVDTSAWTKERSNEIVAEMEDLYNENLPVDQQRLPQNAEPEHMVIQADWMQTGDDDDDLKANTA